MRLPALDMMLTPQRCHFCGSDCCWPLSYMPGLDAARLRWAVKCPACHSVGPEAKSAAEAVRLWGTFGGRMEDILRGWKEIEKYVGLDRKTIISQGYPVRSHGDGSAVFAVRRELLDHACSMPVVKTARIP